MTSRAAPWLITTAVDELPIQSYGDCSFGSQCRNKTALSYICRYKALAGIMHFYIHHTDAYVILRHPVFRHWHYLVLYKFVGDARPFEHFCHTLDSDFCCGVRTPHSDDTCGRMNKLARMLRTVGLNKVQLSDILPQDLPSELAPKGRLSRYRGPGNCVIFLCQTPALLSPQTLSHAIPLLSEFYAQLTSTEEGRRCAKLPGLPWTKFKNLSILTADSQGRQYHFTPPVLESLRCTSSLDEEETLDSGQVGGDGEEALQVPQRGSEEPQTSPLAPDSSPSPSLNWDLLADFMPPIYFDQSNTSYYHASILGIAEEVRKSDLALWSHVTDSLIPHLVQNILHYIDPATYGPRPGAAVE